MPNCTRFRFPAMSSILLLLLTFSQAVFAGWTLNSEGSSFYYVTSKAAAISEINTFAELNGTIDDAGSASVAISLASVDTAIDIRNERMREIVFQVANYPLAEISLTASGARLAASNPGQSFMASYDATVDIRGIQQTMTLELAVTKLRDGGLLVTLAKPLIVNAASFGLAESVEQLREIAGLPSINNNVIIDFTLQFDAQ